MPTTITSTLGLDTRPAIQDAIAASRKINAEFSKNINGASSGLARFDRQLDNTVSRILAFSASFAALGAAAKTIKELTNATIEVEKSLTDINVILNASTDNLKKFGREVFNIAKDTGQSFNIVSKAATEFARQGLGVEETLKRTRDALILTRLSGLDAVSTTEALTATLNSFKREALDSTKVVNALANVDAQFAVSAGDLAEAIKRVGSSAEDTGVSFNSLIALVTSAKQITGREGAVIGNSFKTIFQRIQRPEVLNQLEDLGIEVRNFSGEAIDADKILVNLAAKFDGLSSAQKNNVVQLSAGVFQANIFRAILSDISKETGVYSKALDTAANSTDQAIKRNEKLNLTLSALINRTKENLRQLGSEIGGGTVNPLLRSVLDPLNNALDSDNSGETLGNEIGKTIIKGLGNFLTGPGFILVGGLLGKLLYRLGRDVKDALKSVISVNTTLQQQLGIEKNVTSQSQQRLNVEKEILGVINSQNTAKATVIANPLPYGINPRPIPFTAGKLRGSEIGLGLKPTEIGKINKLVGTETTSILGGGNNSGKNAKSAIDKLLVGKLGMGVFGTEGYKKINEFVDKQVEAAKLSYLEQNKTVLLNKQINEAKRQFVLAEQTNLRGSYQKLAQQRINTLLDQQLAAKQRAANIENRLLMDNNKNAQSVFSYLPFTKSGQKFSEFQKTNPEAAAAARVQSGEKLNKAFLGGALGISLASGFAQQGIGDSTANRRGSSSAVGLLGNIGGNALAGSLFGPQAALVAGVGTLLIGLPKVFRDFNDILPDIAKNLEKISEKGVRFNDTIAQITELTDKLSNPQLRGKDRAELQQKRLNLLFSQDIPKQTTNEILKILNTSDLSANDQIKKIVDIQNKQSTRINEDKLSEILSQRIEESKQGNGIFTTNEFINRSAAAAARNKYTRKLTPEFQQNTSDILSSLGLNEFLATGNNNSTLQSLIGENKISDATRFLSRNAGGRALTGSISGFSESEQFNIIKGLFTGSGPFSTDAQNNRNKNLKEQDKVVENLNNSFKEFEKQINLASFASSVDFPSEISQLVNKKLRRDNLSKESINIQEEGILSREEMLGATPLNLAIRKNGLDKFNQSEAITSQQLGNFGNLLKTFSSFGSGSLETLRKDASKISDKMQRDTVLGLIGTAQGDIRKTAFGFQENGSLDFVSLEETLSRIKEILPLLPTEISEQFDNEIRGLRGDLIKSRDISTDLSKEQIDILETSEKILEQIKMNLGFFRGENLKKLINSGSISGRQYQQSVLDQANENLAANGKLSGEELGQIFSSRFRYNTRDLFSDLKDGAVDFADTFKSETSNAFKEFALNSKSAGDALKGLGLALFGKLLDRSIDSSFNALFGGLSSGLGSLFGGGRTQKFATGGKVTGGSGNRDDVPAMLSAGEYVVKKDVVSQMGDGFFKALNAGALVKYANGGANVLLNNRFDYDNDSRPTSGKANISSSLSNMALTDENNPQNQLRMAREDALYQYLEEKRQYEETKAKALKDFKKAKQQRLIGAYMSAAIGVGGAGLQSGLGGKTPTNSNINSGGINGSMYYSGTSSMGRANGGIIPGFANGGMSMDSIPAMLTGGEYVVRKDVVDRMGVGFFNRLNSGQLNIANGGMVGSASGPNSGGGNNSMMEMLNKLISINESIRDTLSDNNRKIDNLNPNFNSATNNPNLVQGNTNSQGNITNNVTIAITVGKNGSSDSSTNSNGNGDSDSQKQANELGKLIEPAVLKVISQQQRPGGLLQNTR